MHGGNAARVPQNAEIDIGLLNAETKVLKPKTKVLKPKTGVPKTGALSQVC